jgi:Skp family chaperone for outer membrane proteins
MTPARIICIIRLKQINGYLIMKKLFFVLLTLLTSSTHADEVFKCQLKSGKTVYQSLPCEAPIKQKVIEIQKTDPRKIAEEEAKLKAWKEDFAKREAERIKAEKELQDEQDRKATVEALRRSAEYQQQQVYQEKRREELERQNMQRPYLQQHQFIPYYPAYQPIPVLPPLSPLPTYPPSVLHQHNIKEKTFPDTQQSEQNGIKLNKDSAPNKGMLEGYRRP